ncbi:glycosyltransferase [Paenochrobactrum sp. BZR 588]|uniref:glycosyltransferase n=1 Tax=unclassified Paenochrobactrum TaxID=2639760 RepID=UPI00385252FF
MRIVFDMQGLQTESRFRGIGRYTQSLVKAVIRQNKSHEIILVLNGMLVDSVAAIRDAFEHLLPAENIVIWQAPVPVSAGLAENKARHDIAELLRERFLKDLRPDIIHITSLFEGYMDDAVSTIHVFDQDIPVSVMVYDLIPLSNPEEYLKNNAAYNHYYSKKIENLKRADLLLAISEFSKIEAEDLLKIPADKIINISSAVDPCFKKLTLSQRKIDALLQRLQLTRPFILYAGGTDPRKNLPRLIKAYAALPEALRQKYMLLLAGKMSAHERVFLQGLAKSAGLEAGELCFAGYVNDEDLIALYNLCELFVFPSWQEGFGLPALEAMHCGAAVIGSNTSSLPEVVGWEDALFDPFDEQAISNKLLQALTDDVFRTCLKENAAKRAQLFSWDETAKRLIKAWEALYESQAARQRHFLAWSDQYCANNETYQKLIHRLSDYLPQIKQDRQQELINIAQAIELNEKQAQYFNRGAVLEETIRWRLEGPFDSSYSLALLNRELARALAKLGHQVALHSTEGAGDFAADQAFLQANPDLAHMQKQAENLDELSADITSRNLYPPRVEDMKGRINLLHSYGWEESSFPYRWTEKLNVSLQGITVMSEHVRKVLIDNGVSVPIKVAGVGVDHWERVVADDHYQVQGKRFRFLHVSSCFPRKGVDVMLEAYGRQFTRSDDVTLIIKTFANPHNQIHVWLEQIRSKYPNYPDVVIIEEDLSDSQLKKLYQDCHALVAPSRAEGFGLPLAEAMLSGLAVITTRWSGQLDFCTAQNTWLVDYQFSPTDTHFELFNSVWAEPDVEDLALKMREVFEAPLSEITQRCACAREQLLSKHRWEDVAQRNVEAARQFSQALPEKEMRLGWISSWNTRCGIATYSEHLIKSLVQPIRIFASHAHSSLKNDEPNVFRCWNDNNIDDFKMMYEEIIRQRINVIVIQFNYGFFNFIYFKEFLSQLHDAGIVVVVVMHATQNPDTDPTKKLDQLVEELKQCARILVHNCDDLNRLKKIGIFENSVLFPHGILESKIEKQEQKNENSFVLGSYGFFLPHKGLLELIDVVRILRDKGMNVCLKMLNAEYPVPQSAKIIAQARKKIETLQLQNYISINTDFLDDESSIKQLSQTDLVVFPYQKTAESSSGAVRYGITCGTPVAVTPLAIFKDVAPAVFTLRGISPEDIAAGIEDFIRLSVSEKIEQQQRAQKWRDQHAYPVLAQKLYGMLRGLNR